jgi:3-methylcrotonyl-CoA carboxylase alpha subunit
MNGRLQRQLEFAEEEHLHAVTVEYRGNDWLLRQGAESCAMTIVGRGAQDMLIKLGGVAVRGAVVRDGDAFHVFAGGTHAVLTYADPMAHAGEAEADSGRLTAPMPGKIVAVLVSQGDSVAKSTPLLIMEAMKMEHTIAAPANGVVEAILYAVGDQVAEGAQLLSFKPV